MKKLSKHSNTFLRWKYLAYSSHCWTETEIFRSLAIGVIFSVATGIVLTFRLKRSQEIAEDPWEEDFLRWLMNPSSSRQSGGSFLHEGHSGEGMRPNDLNNTILQGMYAPDELPSHLPDVFEAVGEPGGIRSSFLEGGENIRRNGKSAHD